MAAKPPCRGILPWLAPVLLGACADLDPGNATPFDAQALELVELARVGGAAAEGLNAFGSVRDGALLSGVRQFALIDAASQQIHFFGEDGRHVRSVGGRGGGPGESQALRKIWGRPDGGLCSWDVQTTRVTHFGASGAVLSTGHPDLDQMESIRPGFVGFLHDCSFVLRDGPSVMGMRTEPEGLREDTVRFVHFEATGAANRDVASRRGPARWFRNRDGAWGYVDLVFGDELMAFVSGSNLWVGSSAELSWTRIDARSGRSDTVEIVTTPRPATAALVELERARRLTVAEQSDSARATRIRAIYETAGRTVSPDQLESDFQREGVLAAPANDQLPAYDRAVPGPDGSVWIREFPDPRSAASRWLLVTQSGAIGGVVDLPLNADVLAGSAHRLLIREKDDYDADFVRLMQVGREAGGA